MDLKSQDESYKLFSMSEKKKLHVIGTRVGGNLSRAVYLAPHPGFLMLIFFSSPSFVQPKYKIKMDLKLQDKSYKLVFSVRKIETIGTWVGGNLSRAVYLAPHPGFLMSIFFLNHHLNHLDIK